MDVTFLNVGYGESIVITEKGQCIVVDGGSADPSAYTGSAAISIGAFLRWQQISRIDLMIVTHIHDDHIGGLAALAETFDIGKIWINLPPQTGIAGRLAPYRASLCADRSGGLFFSALLSFEKLLTLAAERNIPVETICGESRTASFGAIRLTPIGMTRQEMETEQRAFEAMLAEKDAARVSAMYRTLDAHCNATSLALHISSGESAVLLSGDRVNGWDALAEQHRYRANVLKLTHHGQRDGIPEALVRTASPEAFVICADQDRTFDSAHPDVLQKARAYLQGRSLPERVFVTGDLRDEGGLACAIRFTLASHAGITGITLLH